MQSKTELMQQWLNFRMAKVAGVQISRKWHGTVRFEEDNY